MSGFDFWNFGDQLLIWSVNVLLQVTLVSAIALAIATLVRKSPATRYWLLCSALLLVLFSPAIALVMQSSGRSILTVSLMTSPVVPTDEEIQNQSSAPLTARSSAPSPTGTSEWNVLASPPTPQHASMGLVHENSDPAGFREAPGAHVAEATISRNSNLTPRNANGSTMSWLGWTLRMLIPPLLMIWISGTMFLFIRFAIGWVRLLVILRTATTNTNHSLAAAFKSAVKSTGATEMPELLLSTAVTGPIATGVWRPRVVLPKQMLGLVTARQLHEILLHELAHIVRRDQMMVWLQNLSGTLFWLHPFVWRLNREIAQAREEVCDNYVLASTDPPSYSRTLLLVADLTSTTRSIPGAVGLFTSRWKLESRVAGLLDERRDRKTQLTFRGRALVGVLSATLFMLASLFTITLAIGQQDEEPAKTNEAPMATTEDSKATDSQVTDQLSERTISVKGKITGENGAPVAGVLVAVIGYKPAGTRSPIGETLADGVTNDDGDYALTLRGVNSKSHLYPNLIARTDESAIAWKKIDLDVDESQIDLALQPQQLIQVHLVDIQGQPAANLPVELAAILSNRGSGAMPDGIGLQNLDSRPRAAVPSLKTDATGLLTIPNVPAAYGVFLKVLGSDDFAPQDLALNSGMAEERGEHDATYRPLVKNMKPGEVATIALAPAQIFEGVVYLGDTDKPAAGARITMWASQQNPVGSMVSVEGKTDEQGHFRLNPYPGIRFGIIAYPPDGAAYQMRQLEDLTWTSGEASKNIELRLAPGLLAEGTVVDAKSGKPLAGASVQYHPDRAHNQNLKSDIVTGWQSIQQTDEEGKFKIAVLAGPGTLLFHGPAGGNYVLEQRASGEIENGKPGGVRMYAHAFEKIDPKSGEPLDQLTIKLQPGGTVVAKLVDSSGKKVEHAVFVSTLQIAPFSPQWRGFADQAIDGRAEIRGLGEGQQYPVYFLDSKHQLGATAVLSLNDPSPTIELKPCGSAKARFVDSTGKPHGAGFQLGLHIVVTPGKPRYDFEAYNNGELLADEDFASNVDQTGPRSGPGFETDEKGEMTYTALIPGATYRFLNFVEGRPKISKEFVAQSGETFDMGDIEVTLP